MRAAARTDGVVDSAHLVPSYGLLSNPRFFNPGSLASSGELAHATHRRACMRARRTLKCRLSESADVYACTRIKLYMSFILICSTLRTVPFFKVAPVARSSNKGSHVNGEHLAVLEGLGNVAPDDPLADALDYSSLANTYKYQSPACSGAHATQAGTHGGSVARDEDRTPPAGHERHQSESDNLSLSQE